MSENDTCWHVDKCQLQLSIGRSTANGYSGLHHSSDLPVTFYVSLCGSFPLRSPWSHCNHTMSRVVRDLVQTGPGLLQFLLSVAHRSARASSLVKEAISCTNHVCFVWKQSFAVGFNLILRELSHMIGERKKNNLPFATCNKLLIKCLHADGTTCTDQFHPISW